MDYEEDDQKKEGSVLERIKESPRTVSALIIILIVVAAIYAFSGDQQKNDNDTAMTEGQTTEEAVSTENGEEAMEGSDEAMTEENGEMMEEGSEEAMTPTTTPITKDQLNEQAKQLPEPKKTDTAYVEVAQSGEGITHLARKATTRYLSENDAGYTVTNEHRIYIEDYIQNRLGSQGLSVGEEQNISFDLLKEAVAAAGQLNEQQLSHLSQYTYVLQS